MLCSGGIDSVHVCAPHYLHAEIICKALKLGINVFSEKPLVDIEINSIDAFSNYCLKVQGSKGTLKSTQGHYDFKIHC